MKCDEDEDLDVEEIEEEDEEHMMNGYVNYFGLIFSLIHFRFRPEMDICWFRSL